MSTNTLQLVNRLDVPEIAGHTTRAGIVSYAVRKPHAELWSGFVSDGGRSARTPIIYRDPDAAIRYAVRQFRKGYTGILR